MTSSEAKTLRHRGDHETVRPNASSVCGAQNAAVVEHNSEEKWDNTEDIFALWLNTLCLKKYFFFPSPSAK